MNDRPVRSKTENEGRRWTWPVEEPRKNRNFQPAIKRRKLQSEYKITAGSTFLQLPASGQISFQVQ
ncbi:MAG TPA: hypothetical protein DDW43_10305 [Nitrosomonas sp.]|nr:hypothetical protein [Nitrosomonas sp.]